MCLYLGSDIWAGCLTIILQDLFIILSRFLAGSCSVKMLRAFHDPSINFHCAWEIRYSTDQKKPNRERERERVQNGYRTGTRTRTERVQNGYRTGTERIQNGYRTDIERIRNSNKGKSVLYKRTHSSEHMLVSYAIRVLTRDLKTTQF